MTRKNKILILLCCLFPWMWAAADPINTTVGSGSICPNDEVVIPVTVSNCNGVAAISLVLNFDNTKVNYEGYQNLNNAVSTMLVNQSNGMIYMTWANMSAVDVGDGTLLELRFTGLSNNSGNANLNWNTTQCEYSDVTGTALQANYYNGSVNVYAVPTITSNPTDSNLAEGQSTYFEVNASGQGLSYQWQIKTLVDNTWQDLSNDSHHSNVNNRRLNVNNVVMEMDGNQYRCVVSGTCPSPVTSEAGTLTVVTFVPTIVTSLGSVTICAEQVFSVPVNVTNCNNVGAISLVLNYNSSLVTYVGYENAHPELANGTMRVNATNGAVYFTWASSNHILQIGDGQLISFAFKSASGNSSLTWNNSLCEYSGQAGEALPASYNGSNLNIYFPPSVTSNPTDKTIMEGQSTNFSINASGQGLSYQWQMSQDQGISWETLNNGGHYSNVTTRTLNVNNVVASMDGYRYRCVVSGACEPSATSNYATLHVEPLIQTIVTTAGSINTCSQIDFGIPISVTHCNNVGAISLALAYNTNVMTYTGYEGVNPALSNGQLQVNAANGMVFIAWASIAGANLGDGNLLTLNFTALSGASSMNWNTAYCEYANPQGTPLPTSYVNGNVSVAELSFTITTQPTNQTIIMEEDATFTIEASGTTTGYQWQVSQDQGSSWSNISAGDHYSNPTTNTLSISNVPLDMNGYRYRCAVSGTCGLQYSSIAILTVQLPPNYYAISLSANPIEGGTVEGADAYEEGTSCTVTATPAIGYYFVNWTENGTEVSQDSAYTFIVAADRELVANFALQEIDIIANIVPEGSGTINGTGTYLYGEHVLLTAIPNTGYVFDSWTENGEVVSSNQSISFTAQTDRTLEANFSVLQVNITATPVPVSNGSITGAGTFPYGTTVTLVAFANEGFQLGTWTENDSVVSTNDTLTFMAETDRNLVANFIIKQLNITAVADPAGSGTISGVGTYNYGDPVVLTATPLGQFEFYNWTENGEEVSTQPTISFTAYEHHNLVAHFITTITIAATTDPEESGIIQGAGTYNYAEPVTLTALPNTGFSFVNWTENDTLYSTETSISFTAYENRTFVAHFNPIMHHITVSANNAVAGTVSGGGDYQEGTQATVLAQPNEHYVFVCWKENGVTVSSYANYSFIVWGDRNLVANFIEPALDTTIYAEICYGDNYLQNGFEIYYPELGDSQYSITLPSSQNLDSIVNLTLTVYPVYFFAEDTTLCNATSYTWRGHTYTESGIYYDSLQTVHGCDSIFQLSLELFNTPLGEFTYMTPTNNYPFTSLPITFSWDAVSGAEYYDLYVWDADESMPEEPFASNLRYGNYSTSTLQNYHTYNWFVKARNACYEMSSSVKSFYLDITPSLNVNVTHIDFGEVAMNQSTSTMVTVTGIVLEDELDVQITGEDAAMFSFTQASGWNDYNGGILIVTFNPTTPQYDYCANLVISSGTFTETVTLTGAVSDLYVFNTYVVEDVYAMNSQIPIYGSVTDWNNAPVTDAEVEIGVFVMGMKRTLQAMTDNNGQFSAVFEPMPSESGYYTVNSGRVGNHSTAVHDDFNIPGMAVVTSDYILCAVTQDQPKTDSILIRNKSNLPLNNIQLQTLSAPEGCSFSFSPLNLGGLEEDYLVYTVTGSTLTQGNYYEEVRLKAMSNEGAETVITIWYYCMESRGVLDVVPHSLVTTMTKGKSKIVDVMLTNNGTGATGNIVIDLPDVEWMSVVGNDTLPSLAVNDTAYFSLRFSPDDEIPLVQFSGSIAINSERGDSVGLAYTITAVSDSTGMFVIDVTDDYTWNTNNGNGPHLEGAEVTLKGYYSLETVAQGYTDANGIFQVDNLPEGYYRLHVEADHHSQYDNNILITAGETNHQNIYLQYQAITYSWTVEPTEIEDEYTYELNVVFETHVPVPVVVIEAPKKLPEFDESYTFNYVITNHGLIDANDLELHVPISDDYLFTPLFDYVDTLQALTTIVIPCVVTHKDSRLETMKSDCAEWGLSWMEYTYKCLKNDGTWKVETSSGYVYTIIGDRPCGPPLGGSGGNGGIGFFGFCYSGNPFNTNPIIEMLINDNHCNNCIRIFFDAVLTLVELVPIAGNGVSAVIAYDDFENGNIVDGAYGTSSIIVSFLPGIGQTLGSLMTICKGIHNIWEDIVGCYQFFSGINKNGDNGDLQLLPIELRDFLDFAPNYMGIFDRMFHGVELIFNDTAWLDSDINELNNFMSLVRERNSLYGYVDVDQSLISLTPTNINENQVYVFIERYNNTIDIINGQTINSNNYIPIDSLYNIIGEIIGIENESKELEYESGEDRMMHLMINANNYLAMHNSESVCAKVTIQFTQKMTMTREAFEGTLTIHNGHDSNPMETIDVNFVIKDAEGNDCTNLFQINTTSLNNITGIDGTGSLDAGMDGMAKIQFIPTKYAAPTEPKLYYFGGTFSFIDPYTSDELVYDLYPVEITVNPSPDLYVDYFMQRDILGDDALTTNVVEPSIPAELGVIINNKGAGIAKNVILETAEPEIIDNEKGLAIDFAMYGASFNGSPRQLGLMQIPFGNIGSGQTAVGEWLFTSSLLGHFVSYEAHVIHNSSYGNPDLSLVSHLDIHELIHPIYAYGNLDDGINDFLVNDNPDAYDQPDSIYFSHGGRTAVGIVNNISFDHYVEPQDTIVILTINPSRIGWNYGVTEDPGRDNYDLVSCTRDFDGQVIPLNNVWQTFVTIPDSGDPIYENKLHIVDTLSNDVQDFTYTLVYSMKNNLLDVLEITGIPESYIDYPLESFTVRFNEAIIDSTFTYEDMTLKCQNGPNLMDSTIVITKVNDSIYDVNISGLTNETGLYVLNVSTLNIKDSRGYYGYKGKQATWVQVIEDYTQTMNFAQGWNWWSTYIEQEGIDGLGMLEEALGDNGITIHSQANGYTNYYENYGWYGSLSSIDNISSYKIKTSAPCSVALTGQVAVPSQHPITLNHGWTWMGYVPLTAMDVNEALSGLEATVGDKLKSQEGYAEYYEDYGWYGSLNTIEPDMGLMYYSSNDDPVTFTYPDSNRGGELKANLTPETNHWKPNIYAYSDNMTVMAVVKLDDSELSSDNYELAAFATDGECRGSVKLIYAEPLHRHVAFLTVSGKDATELSFRLYDSEIGEEYGDAEESLNFVANAIVGDANELYVVHFRGTTGIDDFASGVQFYPNPVNRGEPFSINITEDVKRPVCVEIVNALGVETLRATSVQMPATLTAPTVAGIYTMRITVEGKGTVVRKLVVK